MSATTADLSTTVKAQAEEIVTSGENIRPRLTKVVTQAACQSQEGGQGLVDLVRAAVAGAREGLARAVPKDRDDALRQVVDALGDGLSQTALAAKLAVQEAMSSSRQYTEGDLVRLRDDLSAVHALFKETVAKGLQSTKTLTTAQVSNAMQHAGRVADRIQPVFGQVFDAVRQHPIVFAREGIEAGVSAGQSAAGSLFQALGRMLQRAGDELRREQKSDK
jgi:hypothetical protein